MPLTTRSPARLGALPSVQLEITKKMDSAHFSPSVLAALYESECFQFEPEPEAVLQGPAISRDPRIDSRGEEGGAGAGRGWAWRVPALACASPCGLGAAVVGSQPEAAQGPSASAPTCPFLLWRCSGNLSLEAGVGWVPGDLCLWTGGARRPGVPCRLQRGSSQDSN